MAYITLSYRDFDEKKLGALNDDMEAVGLRDVLGSLVWLYYNAQRAERDQGTSAEIAKWSLIAEADRAAWIKALYKNGYVTTVPMEKDLYLIADMKRQLKHLERSRKANQWRPPKAPTIADVKVEIDPKLPVDTAELRSGKQVVKIENIEIESVLLEFKHKRCPITLKRDGSSEPWLMSAANPSNTSGFAGIELPKELSEEEAKQRAREIVEEKLIASGKPAAKGSGPARSSKKSRAPKAAGAGESTPPAPASDEAKIDREPTKTPVKEKAVAPESQPQPESDATSPKRKATKASPSARLDEQRERTPGTFVWTAYRRAYMQRYNVEPIRNVKVNSQCTQLAKQVGLNVAETLVEYFVSRNDAFYQHAKHPIGMCLQQAQKLLTEMATGTKMSINRSRQQERHADVDDAINQYMGSQKEAADGSKDVSR